MKTLCLPLGDVTGHLAGDSPGGQNHLAETNLIKEAKQNMLCKIWPLRFILTAHLDEMDE
jgi:hypothetical protein